MNILVLGGTGAMGAPLSKLLVASGNNVYVTSRSAHKSCERLHYLQGNAKDEIFLKACLSRMHYDAIVDFTCPIQQINLTGVPVCCYNQPNNIYS